MENDASTSTRFWNHAKQPNFEPLIHSLYIFFRQPTHSLHHIQNKTPMLGLYFTQNTALSEKENLHMCEPKQL